MTSGIDDYRYLTKTRSLEEEFKKEYHSVFANHTIANIADITDSLKLSDIAKAMESVRGVDPGYKEECKRLRERVEKLKVMNEQQKKMIDEFLAEKNSTKIDLMESDIGKLRAVLGSERFDAIVTGKEKAPVPPPAPRGFNWNEARLVR